VRDCSTATFTACSAAGDAIETRRGTCRAGPGCTSDLVQSLACPAPTCTTMNLGAGSVSMQCSNTCTVNSDGRASCQQNCITCPRGCSGNACARVIAIDPIPGLPGGGIIANP
jgi:hypothetical protein